MRRETIPRQLLRLPQLLILGLVYLLVRAASKAPSIVESFYSQKLYPIIRNAVSAVTRVVPFCLAELIAAIVAAAIVIVLIVRVIKLILIRKKALVRLISLVITVALTAAYLVFAFYVMWGFNLFRTPIDEKLDLPEREYTAEELYSVCVDLAENASRLREQVETDADGVFTWDLASMKESVRRAYAEFGSSRPSFKADVPPVKEAASSKFLSACGISGMYIFLTEEPLINTDEPFLYIPMNAAHETAHYVGYAREEEANFLAFLVCADSSDPELAYSGYMHALAHCGSALASSDADLYARLREYYSEGMLKDLANYSEHYRKYSDTEIWNTANDLNDNYLKLNKQEKGVLSYLEDTALILRYYDSRRFFNQ
ncbi:MAG: DUF3810 domain-containing protein [Clostridia bacterium]|nr:DUF3810 domain-containing protein [Clostridia bacterium]